MLVGNSCAAGKMRWLTDMPCSGGVQRDCGEPPHMVNHDSRGNWPIGPDYLNSTNLQGPNSHGYNTTFYRVCDLRVVCSI